MVKLRTFDVIYSNPQGVFRTGDLVRGHVVVNFSEPTKLRSVQIECQGKAKVHWDKWVDHYKTSPVYECYRAEECYFKKELCLYGNGPGGAAVLHPAGRQMYNFEFPLPADLPSSFEGAHGYVRYFCKATIERPWKFDSSSKKAFSVVSELDLNRERGVRAPIQFERQTPVQCCCFISGSVSATFRIEQRGYVPGQNIFINAEVHNATNTTVSKSKVILCQHINFYALHHGMPSSAISCSNKLKRYRNSRIVKCIMKGEIQPGQTELWENEALQVPPLPPSRLDGCKIIDIFYTVTFSVEPNWGSRMQVSTEIIIGTVPLRHAITCPPSYSTVLLDRRPSSPPPPFEEGGFLSPNVFGFYLDDIPPPSYEESVFGRSQFQDEEEEDQLDYTPRYAYYNWGRLSPSLLFSAPELSQGNNTNTLEVSGHQEVARRRSYNDAIGINAGEREREQESLILPSGDVSVAMEMQHLSLSSVPQIQVTGPNQEIVNVLTPPRIQHFGSDTDSIGGISLPVIQITGPEYCDDRGEGEANEASALLSPRQQAYNSDSCMVDDTTDSSQLAAGSFGILVAGGPLERRHSDHLLHASQAASRRHNDLSPMGYSPNRTGNLLTVPGQYLAVPGQPHTMIMSQQQQRNSSSSFLQVPTIQVNIPSS